MKKILAAVLSVVLCLFMALPAFADEEATGTAENDYNGETKAGEVNITVTGDVVHVYLVDIVFTTPTFTFSSGSKWDPKDYVYKHDNNGTWTGEGTVTITNHSDLPVNYTVEAENVVDTYGKLNIEVTDKGTGAIEACAVGTKRGSKFAEATFKVTGTPTVDTLATTKLGDIIVKITK